MPKAPKPRSFDEIVSHLRSLQFDVREAHGVANQGFASPVFVSRYDCGAVLGRGVNGGVVLVQTPGVLLGGEIAILLDRGYQKFFRTKRLEIAATADRLKAEHRFREELDQVIGEAVLYNEAIGSVSDQYMYDRVKGRDKDAPPLGLAPWDVAGVSGGH
jgi:hypothetical protein